MKNHLRFDKSIQKVGVYILVLTLVFVSIAATPPSEIEQRSVSDLAITRYQSAQLNSNLSDEEKIKTAIDAYFTTRYEGQKLLEEQDFSPVLEDKNLDWVKKEKDKREVELYIADIFDLKYIDYSYTLDYDSIEIKNNNNTFANYAVETGSKAG